MQKEIERGVRENFARDERFSPMMMTIVKNRGEKGQGVTHFNQNSAINFSTQKLLQNIFITP